MGEFEPAAFAPHLPCLASRYIWWTKRRRRSAEALPAPPWTEFPVVCGASKTRQKEHDNLSEMAYTSPSCDGGPARARASDRTNEIDILENCDRYVALRVRYRRRPFRARAARR